MYDQIKKDITQDYYQKNYPNDGQRFIAWYLRNIYNLDIHEAKDCITDGADDKQIDAVYVDEANCIVHIIQGKFYSGETVNAEPLRETLASWILIKNLEKLQNSANAKLKVKINEISTALDDDYEICFELITTSTFTESAQKDLDQFNEKISSDANIKASLEVIDKDSLAIKYADALNKNRPYINYDFTLEKGKFMELSMGGSKAVIAAIPLWECVKIPGIKDGSLFRRNVRQFLGNSKKVSKDIAETIRKKPNDFFFLHNGITAVCSKMVIADNTLSVKELNVVNGCQSLSTIYNCGEAAKKAVGGYIMFRFYETGDANRADSISTSTNSQSPVKARDLRSNDKYVLKMKKDFEQFYSPKGYFVTKRGETVDKTKYADSHIVYLTNLGKQMIAWNSQRPTISYSESKIFDKYLALLN